MFTLAIGSGRTPLFGLINLALRPSTSLGPRTRLDCRTDARRRHRRIQYEFSSRRSTTCTPLDDAVEVFGVMPRIGGLSSEGKAAQFFFAAVSNTTFPARHRRRPRLALHAAVGIAAGVVLGHSFWMKHFGGTRQSSPRVRINGRPAVVHRGCARGFAEPSSPSNWMATSRTRISDTSTPKCCAGCITTGKPCRSALRAIAAWRERSRGGKRDHDAAPQLGREYPDTDAGRTARVVPSRWQGRCRSRRSRRPSR